MFYKTTTILTTYVIVVDIIPVQRVTRRKKCMIDLVIAVRGLAG